MSTWTEKYRRLLDQLTSQKHYAVAFSGGVDSTLLLKASVDAVGSAHVLAITADTPMHLRSERNEAIELAAQISVKQLLIPLALDDVSGLQTNPSDRCYRCKQAILTRCLAALPPDYSLCEGSNCDDLTAHRPGWQAVQELGVCSPLVAAGMNKQDVREASRQLGLPTWDKPSQSCLLTRFPHDTLITADELGRVEHCEEGIKKLGLRMVRVRSIGSTARLEFDPREQAQAMLPGKKKEILSLCQEAGFEQVEIDPAGYRSGSMD